MLLTGSLLRAEAPTVEAVNASFGGELFSGVSLWEEDADRVARRLGWPGESRTATQASYRLYPSEGHRHWGARPYSLALYALGDRPERLSMVFANKGDLDQVQAVRRRAAELEDARPAERREVERQRKGLGKELAGAIAADGEEIRSALTALFGNPKRESIGSSSVTRERVERWDWGEHAFILSVQDGEYTALRIQPTEAADARGRLERTHRVDLLRQTADNVVRRPNGDVIISNIPMVNQGPKGYCVPATWERYLRYVGLPADMYLLAMAGNTQPGGGSSVAAMTAAAEAFMRRAGRRSERLGASLEIRDLARTLDQGLPIMWMMMTLEDHSLSLTERAELRRGVEDWEEYRQQLERYRLEARNLQRDLDRSHVCMIIGYNAGTGELATSDSWGPAYEERWMTVEEARAISLGDLRIVR
ncbi:MAG: hypothetical protein SNJ84_07470 [Verrucomicrobiia bacterium]